MSVVQTVRKEAVRDGYGRGLVALGREHEEVVALDADLADSTRSAWFGKEFPERFFQMGIAEQDMLVTAAGLAHAGMVPFASSFAIFVQRGWEQMRNSVARQNLPVKLVGSHGGLMTGQDGSSAHALEDVGIFRNLPNMAVFVPADSVEAEKAVQALYDHKGPAYMRTTRASVPVIHGDDHTVELGRFRTERDGDDVALFACGPMVANANIAADMLEKEGVSVRVVNASSIRPLDHATVEKAARDCGAIVTAEDHFITGALGSAVAESLAEHHPAVLERIGVRDIFTTSGTPEELYERFGLNPHHVVEAAQRAMRRK
ncbi:MAG: transketolase family protein [Euryarchaeota archaeon]|nr:transketolase family protein [Euryarchaeota archaeon]